MSGRRNSRATGPTESRPHKLSPVLDYIQRGWRLIPIKMEEKKPSVRWGRYQSTAPSRSTITRWFTKNDYGVAVVFGEPSGGLISRDFDTMEAYDKWAERQPDLAALLPTVATRRGRHVYARARAEDVVEVRRRLGRSTDATGAIKTRDGELRAGCGCYSVLPPSIHPSGHRYHWVVPLPDGPVPMVDLLKCGFVEFDPCDREHGENRGVQRDTEAITIADVVGEAGRLATPLSSTVAEWGEPVHAAILGSLPSAVGQRHEQVFRLARALKAIPALAGAAARDLEPLVRRFHALALPHISTKPFEETWIDFLRAWKNVKFPLGQEPMAEIMRKVEASPLPQAAMKYEQAKLQTLVSLCHELQRVAGDGPFFLACRTAGRLLGVDHSTANRWLFLLAVDDTICEVERGSKSTGRASRYRYLHPLD